MIVPGSRINPLGFASTFLGVSDFLAPLAFASRNPSSSQLLDIGSRLHAYMLTSGSALEQGRK